MRPRYIRIIIVALVWIAFQSAIGGYIHGNSLGQIIANHMPLGGFFFLIVLVFVANNVIHHGRPIFILPKAARRIRLFLGGYFFNTFFKSTLIDRSRRFKIDIILMIFNSNLGQLDRICQERLAGYEHVHFHRILPG